MKRPLRKSIAIIGEGMTEQEYFNHLRRMRRYQIRIKPDLPGGSSYTNIFKKAKALLKKEFDLVFCLIDLDAIVNNRQVEKFLRDCKKLPKLIIPVISNPCTELWFLLHFEKIHYNQYFPTCKSVEDLLVNHIPTYEKTERSLARSSTFSYLESAGDEKTALKNAKEAILVVKQKANISDYSFTEIATVLELLEQCAQCSFAANCDKCKHLPSVVAKS